MANLIIKDGNGTLQEVKVTGSGTTADPFVTVHDVQGSVVVSSGHIIVDSGLVHAIIDSGSVNAAVTGTVSLTGGKSGVFMKEFQPAIVLSTTPYSVNDSLGGIIQVPSFALANGGTSVIRSVMLYDKEQKHPNLDILFYRSNPTSSTWVDNAPVVVQSVDAVKFINSVDSNDLWKDYGSHSVMTLNNLNIPCNIDPAAATLFMGIMIRDAITWSSTGSLLISLGVEQN